MTDTSYSLGPLWAEIRAELRDYRESRATIKALRRDLASDISTDHLNEWNAILGRYGEEETAAIRRILIDRHSA
jgi:hypothetical protein